MGCLGAVSKQPTGRLYVWLFVLVLIALMSPEPAGASGEVWREIASAGPAPAPRSDMAVIRDNHHERLVMFGGQLGNGDLADEVWTLSLTPLSERWTRTPLTSGPAGRYNHTMIYDAANQHAVIFGGMGANGPLNDVWVLDLKDSNPRWTSLPPVTGPSPRSNHTAIYDAQNERMIVYGGVLADGSPTHDVWALDLRAGQESWHLLSPAVVGDGGVQDMEPPARAGHTAIYDPRNHWMVVFGGMGPDGRADAAVWVLNLQPGNEAWQQVSSAGGPGARSGHAAVYDTRNRRMIVYGGRRDAVGPAADVWALGLVAGVGTWERVVPAGSPSARSDAGVLYDERDHRAIVFGGQSLGNEVLGDTVAMELTLAGPPTIQIIAPDDGDLVNKTSLAVEVTIENFVLDPYRAGRGPERVDFGSWRVLVDGEVRETLSEPGHLVAQVQGLTAGEHLIKAELVNNRNAPIGLEDVIVVNVRPGWPGIRIVTPGRGMRSYENDIEVSVAVENFDIGPAGQIFSRDRGFWRIGLDGVWQDVLLTDLTYTLQDVPRGSHEIQVELRTANDEPFTPRIMDSVVVHILVPKIHILFPPDGSLINSSSVEVKIEVADFILDPDRVGGPNEIGYGHWHLLLDDVYQAFVTGTEGLAATLTELAPGPHVIAVELANNDHTLLGIQDRVNVTIAQGRPSVRILSPVNNSTVDGPEVDVMVAVEHFILDAENIGHAPVPGHGHWHLFVDGVFQIQTARRSAVAVLPHRGTHRIIVTLSNNDHTSLDPPVIATTIVQWPHQQYFPLIQK